VTEGLSLLAEGTLVVHLPLMPRTHREMRAPLYLGLVFALGLATLVSACGADTPGAATDAKGGGGSSAGQPVAAQAGKAGSPTTSAGGASGGAVSSGGSPVGGGAPSAGGASGGGGASAGTGTGGAAGGSGGTTTSPGATSCKSSAPGLSNCGDSQDESCCLSLPVPGGTYSRTYQNTGSGATGKADPATISTYALDKYEVTVARFREYVKYLENGGMPPAAGSGKHTHLNGGQGLADSGKSGSFEAGWDASWNSKIPSGSGATAKWKSLLTSKSSGGGGGCSVYGTWTDEPGKNELLPITCTSWYESYAFCIWDGGFLPSEAEWKYAAAGGDEQREYPWGTDAPGSNSDYAIYDCCFPNAMCSATSGHDTCTGLVNVAPVGYAKKGVGRYGQADLIGSVWEWLVDKYASAYVNPCNDCAYLTGSTTNRVLPGAGFHTGASLGATLLYSSNRSQISYDAETYRGDYAVGVRCGRAP
jgi:sulfatase modifying factor 1